MLDVLCDAHTAETLVASRSLFPGLSDHASLSVEFDLDDGELVAIHTSLDRFPEVRGDFVAVRTALAPGNDEA